jgi:APA family basic amino acid/polyamine antiporter
MSGLFRRKPIETAATRGGARLAPTLSWPHLIALGVGSIVGTGILTLIGTGVGRAGPAILLSFAIAGVICACAALAYSEMATMMPASGGAYTYSYAVLGEVIAWVVGWSLILEYSLVVSTVAVGWSGFAAPLLIANGFPPTLTEGPSLGGIANLPAIFIIAVVAGLLCFGTRESARLNTATPPNLPIVASPNIDPPAYRAPMVKSAPPIRPACFAGSKQKIPRPW